ncbi:LD-carboxypeptidase [Desulfobacter hydrogenophilus]|uniref:LD-carboxypeptidase n=1 Tax=Desulfobacter hydrogenophilus TaxID=2291 RepID=A0A328FHC0_9BACT|nr:LD-carboxypeptidase [Desulfobacter hydrogenophilus]NDY71583.1 LD-carboxypeptidase [Desulfobacter hydrogenophilus]QBH15360.1 LD-carboxypeptidase [Desulfobacter hydrogenophilus]RAM02437.1 LD-carboxypeptidase [Desulfobacter hydrogenophilus]
MNQLIKSGVEPVFCSLKPKDVIGVAAPSARFDTQAFQEGVLCLESMGFEVHIPNGITSRYRYLAGTDQQRADVLNSLFADPGIKGIIAARGGFGAMRLLPLLDWDVIAGNPKLFMGFSDPTALISALVCKAGICALHGPNLVSLGRADEKTLDSFAKTVAGRFIHIDLPSDQVVAGGRATGRLLGGNLATLVHMIGTAYQPDFTGSILFIEDVGEPAYKIDRMLSQMKMAGVLEGLRGVVTGSFEYCNDEAYIPQIIQEVFCDANIPICMGIDVGHGAVNLSLPMGGRVILDADRACLQWDFVVK